MRNGISIMLALLMQLFAVSLFATPYVANVVAKQRFPWNGLVDVKYEIVGSTNDHKCAYGVLSATDKTMGKAYSARTFVKPLDLSEGEHHAIWNMSADVELVSTNVAFAVSIESPSLYLVVDLSGGKDANSYPVSELSAIPEGGWTEEYKTTNLVLRLIEPGSFKMNGSYDVTLTKPYYMGIFEVTQKQYELVTGSNPSRFKGDTLPVEYVSWNMIRGDSSAYNWPTVKTVASSSFVGLLQLKTGLNFDLPTEAQWEYACRAGTTTKYYWGDSMNGAYAWYSGNSSSTTHEVGTREPNAFGLYDMSGNVWEWCLDWYGNLSSGVDPQGSFSGAFRVERGGSWSFNESRCTSSHRSYSSPSRELSDNGFRLVRTLSE